MANLNTGVLTLVGDGCAYRLLAVSFQDTAGLLVLACQVLIPCLLSLCLCPASVRRSRGFCGLAAYTEPCYNVIFRLASPYDQRTMADGQDHAVTRCTRSV
jgi:hypothetical protein